MSRYCIRGFEVIDGGMDTGLAKDLSARAMRLYTDHAIRKEGESSKGGRSFYFVFDGFAVQEHFPELTGWYDAARHLMEQVTDEKIVLSPHPRSAVNVKVYSGARNGQGWHHDTNPVSALLYFTSRGAPTELVDLKGVCHVVHPYPGRLLVMQGRDVLHHVPTTDQLRITAPLNYYVPGDTDRPDWIDAAIYENAPAPRLV